VLKKSSTVKLIEGIDYVPNDQDMKREHLHVEPQASADSLRA
jgi:hypothetical protein